MDCTKIEVLAVENDNVTIASLDREAKHIRYVVNTISAKEARELIQYLSNALNN